MSKLNDKQILFCQEYLIDLNATQAAIRAGYSVKTAGQQGFDLLKNPEIQSRITKNMKKREERTEITQDRVLKELGRLAFLDIRKAFDDNGNLLPIKDMDDETAAAISGLEVVRAGEGFTDITSKIRLIDKKGSLELVARHLGMFEKDNKQRKSEFNFGDILGELDGSSAGLPEAQE